MTLKRDRTVNWTLSLCACPRLEKFLEACLVHHFGNRLPGSLPQINLSPEAWNIVISEVTIFVLQSQLEQGS